MLAITASEIAVMARYIFMRGKLVMPSESTSVEVKQTPGKSVFFFWFPEEIGICVFWFYDFKCDFYGIFIGLNDFKWDFMGFTNGYDSDLVGFHGD